MGGRLRVESARSRDSYRVFFNAKYCVFYAKKLIWDAKNEMQCVPGTHKIDRTLRCKINFWWQKFCLGPLIQKRRSPWDSSWNFLLKTLIMFWIFHTTGVQKIVWKIQNSKLDLALSSAAIGLKLKKNRVLLMCS